MSTWFERFKNLRIEKELTQQQIADALGKDTTSVSRYENGKGSKDMPFIFKKNLTDLFTSDELSYIETGKILESEQNNSAQVLVDTDKFISIPIVTAKVSGSPVGEIPYEVVERGEVSIAKMLFKTMPNIENVQAVEVIGNSMSPRINPGDYVIIDKMRHFDHDGVYVMQFDSMLLVKRLQVTTKGIKIISDNRMYDEDFYDPENDQRLMNIVGKVILVINRDMASF